MFWTCGCSDLSIVATFLQSRNGYCSNHIACLCGAPVLYFLLRRLILALVGSLVYLPRLYYPICVSMPRTTFPLSVRVCMCVDRVVVLKCTVVYACMYLRLHCLFVCRPRPAPPLSAVLTEDEAATLIQAGYRGYIVSALGLLHNYV